MEPQLTPGSTSRFMCTFRAMTAVAHSTCFASARCANGTNGSRVSFFTPFRFQDRSSEFIAGLSSLPKTGAYLIEKFMPTGGTDIKVCVCLSSAFALFSLIIPPCNIFFLLSQSQIPQGLYGRPKLCSCRGPQVAGCGWPCAARARRQGAAVPDSSDHV